MMFLSRVCILCVLVVWLTACDEAKQAQKVTEAAPEKSQTAAGNAGESASPPEAAQKKRAPASVDGRPTGIVTQQKYTADYVYLEIEKSDKSKVWAAAAVFKGSVGDTVFLPGKDALVMKNFQSKTLSRTFEEVYFVREVERPGGAPGSAASSQPGGKPASAAASGPANAAKPTPGGAKKVAQEGVSGKVLKAQSVGEYTYLHLSSGGKEVWVAGTKSEVKPGDMVIVKGGVVMSNFHSKTLDRTFEEILFANEIVLEKK